MEDPCEKDQFYGCDCQRYLAVGLLMPVLVLLSVFGGAAMLILLPGREFFFFLYENILSLCNILQKLVVVFFQGSWNAIYEFI